MDYSTNYEFRLPSGSDPADIDDINYNFGTILDGELKEMADDVADLTTTVSGHTTSIGTLQGKVTALEQTADELEHDVSSLETTVGGHTTSISGLGSRMTSAERNISSLAGEIETLQQTVDTPDTGLSSRMTAAEGDITTLETTVGGHTNSIGTLESEVGDLKTTVNTAGTGLSARMTAAEGDITSLETTVGGHTTSIGANASAITSLETTVSGHTTSIGANASAITALQGRCTALETAVGQSYYKHFVRLSWTTPNPAVAFVEFVCDEAQGMAYNHMLDYLENGVLATGYLNITAPEILYAFKDDGTTMTYWSDGHESGVTYSSVEPTVNYIGIREVTV